MIISHRASFIFFPFLVYPLYCQVTSKRKRKEEPSSVAQTGQKHRPSSLEGLHPETSSAGGGDTFAPSFEDWFGDRVSSHAARKSQDTAQWIAPHLLAANPPNEIPSPVEADSAAPLKLLPSEKMAERLLADLQPRLQAVSLTPSQKEVMESFLCFRGKKGGRPSAKPDRKRAADRLHQIFKLQDK